MMTKACTECNTSLSEDDIFCISCGKKYVEPTITINKECTKCKNPVQEDQLFCSYCGEKNESKPPIVYCAKCGTEKQENENFCPSCGSDFSEKTNTSGNQDTNLNFVTQSIKVDEAEADKNPIEKYKIKNSSGRKKKIRIFILIAFSLFIIFISVFGWQGSGIPTVIDIYKYENFKNNFFKTILTINSCEIEDIVYNVGPLNDVEIESEEAEDVNEETTSNINRLPLPTRSLVRNLKNLPGKDVIISDHSCVNIHYPKLFNSASDTLLDQVCYNETSLYSEGAMVFESPESLTIKGFGPVKMELRLFHLSQRDDKFNALLTIRYDMVDDFEGTLHTEISVNLEIKK